MNRHRDPAIHVIVVIVVIFAVMLIGQVIRAVDKGTFPPPRITDTQETRP